MEVLSEAPKPSSFVPLAEHQSVTPASFYEGPPVLHYYSDRCKIIVLEQEASSSPALANFISKAPSTSQTGSSNGDGPHVNGSDAVSESRKSIEDVDVWVTSDKLFLFSNAFSTGISIPYPSISLHAIQSSPEEPTTTTDTTSQAVYMQLVADSAGDSTQSEDVEPDSISMTIIPTASGPPTSLVPADIVNDAEIETERVAEQTPVAAMFTALSNCSNLHPDPMDDEDMDMDGGNIVMGDGGEAEEMDDDEKEDGTDAIESSILYQRGLIMPGGSGLGLPPPMPGSGGWITAENMHEFLDENGNWLEQAGDDEEEEGFDDKMEEDASSGQTQGPLGPGAGTTRQRDGNGHGDGDETKWRRTE